MAVSTNEGWQQFHELTHGADIDFVIYNYTRIHTSCRVLTKMLTVSDSQSQEIDI